MRRLPVYLAFAFAALTVVAAVHDEPQLRYSWDQCDPVVLNKDFAGPAVYRQTFSAVDLPAGFNAFSISIGLTGPHDAWLFYEGGCQGAERFTAVPRVAGCEEIPGLELQWIMQPPVTPDDPFGIGVTGYLDPPLAADIPGRVGLVTLEFDHALTGTTCRGETSPMCFHVSYPTYNLAGVPFQLPFAVVDNYISWQDAPNTLGCPGATPVRAQTWGRVKVLYR